MERERERVIINDKRIKGNGGGKGRSSTSKIKEIKRWKDKRKEIVIKKGNI